MTQAIDQYFLDQLGLDQLILDQLSDNHRAPYCGSHLAEDVSDATYLAYFDAQAQSRHLDFAARWLQSNGHGFYTISSAGHESNAAVAMALRPTDPALLHYRSGAFYAARAGQLEGTTPIRDVLLGMVAAADDPISGGRHKVFGSRALAIIPQTSTIGSHLPRAVGVAFALDRAARMGVSTFWPTDAVVVTSFGDASANHSTVSGALNTAAYCVHRGLNLPLLLVCEDNGLGISTKSPAGWIAATLASHPGMDYRAVDGADPRAALTVAHDLVAAVRSTRRPAILHLSTVRFMGHAGSDAEVAYRSASEIQRELKRDPLLATARLLIARGILEPDGVRSRYEAIRATVMTEAERVSNAPHLSTATAVMAPLVATKPGAVRDAAARVPEPDERRLDRKPPEEQAALTLSQSINAALGDVMATCPQALVFGEDVALKGGVYGVTRGLQKRFGTTRVFDTVLDEQTIFGLALGAAVSGLLPIPEIQYLAYLHNAEDQLRGEAATLAFFSNGQYRNGLVVRVASLAYQKGFGGHFHNDNSIAVLRDIPGLVVAVASHPSDAPALLRTCVALASEEQRVVVFLEPIALYHRRDLYADGDGLWTDHYAPPADWPAAPEMVGKVNALLDGRDLLIVSFGNGVPMSLCAAANLQVSEIACTVLDLRWLSPLPVADLLNWAGQFGRILVVDETRAAGGVSEGVVTALVDAGYSGAIRRVASKDSLIPLGPAAGTVLLSEDDIVTAALAMFD